MDIAVIGAGSVGRALGRGLGEHGHAVTFGVRDPGDARHADLGRVATTAEAARGAAVVIVAVPASAVAGAIGELGLVGGQVVVDATNAVGMPVPDGFDTMGDLVASHVPAGASVVKAFNTIGAEHLGDGRMGEQHAFLPIAGDADGVAVVLPLAGELGFEAVSLGGREAFRLVEDHARLWIHLAFRCGWGRGFAFGTLRR